MKTTQAPGRSVSPAPASPRRFYGRTPSLSSGQPESAEPSQPSIERAERFGHSLDRLRQPSPAPAEPTNAPVQRLVSVKGLVDKASSITAKTRGLAAALKDVPKKQQDQIIENLSSLATQDKEHKFNNWDVAINRAKSAAKSQSSRTRVVRNQDLKKKVVESEESSSSDSSSEESSSSDSSSEESSSSDSSSEESSSSDSSSQESDSESDFSEFSSDNDEGLPQVQFDDGGRFANKAREKLSKPNRSALIGRLGLTHTDTGHGPHKTDKQLSDSALLQKGSGKFSSDKAMFRALKRTKRAIRKKEIDPKKRGNQFIRMPRKASVAFKKSGPTAKKVETRKGRVFFKDKKIKSIHPFAEDAAEDADIDE